MPVTSFAGYIPVGQLRQKLKSHSNECGLFFRRIEEVTTGNSTVSSVPISPSSVGPPKGPEDVVADFKRVRLMHRKYLEKPNSTAREAISKAGAERFVHEREWYDRAPLRPPTRRFVVGSYSAGAERFVREPLPPTRCFVVESYKDPRVTVINGPRESVYIDDRYPNRPSSRYERHEERRYPEERWVDEREFRPRQDYAQLERAVEKYLEPPYSERAERWVDEREFRPRQDYAQ
jgi:hypothetical protein